MRKKKKLESSFDGRILPNILDFNVNLDAQLISKSNYIFGASTLILIFILNRFLSIESPEFSMENLPLIILLTGSFITSLSSISIILPKVRIFSKKERIKEDILYYKNILKFYSRKDYCSVLKDLPTANKRITEAYANQIYSLATNILPYKFKLLKISGWVLITSIFLSLISYFLTLFII